MHSRCLDSRLGTKAGTASLLCASAALVLLLSGCTYSQHLANAAVDYNSSLEQANNEILLRNIVRASLDHPLHFSGVSIMRGNITTGGTVSAQIPFGGDAASNFVVSPSATATTSPSIDIVPLDTQEFFRGLLTPVSPGLFVLLLEEQGWDGTLLVNLLVQELHIGGCLYRNDPSDMAQLEAFQRMASTFLGAEAATEEVLVGPAVPAAPATALPTIIQAAKEGFEVRQVGENLQLVRRQPLPKLKFGELDALFAPPSATVVPDNGDQFQLYAPPPGFKRPEDYRARPEDNAKCPSIERDGVGITERDGVILRSAAGVIRYLGQFTSTSVSSKFKPIEVDAGEDQLTSVVQVSYLGRTYSVQKGDRASMRTLALLSQLIAINKSSKDLPVTQSVISLGG